MQRLQKQGRFVGGQSTPRPRNNFGFGLLNRPLFGMVDPCSCTGAWGTRVAHLWLPPARPVLDTLPAFSRLAVGGWRLASRSLSDPRLLCWAQQQRWAQQRS